MFCGDYNVITMSYDIDSEVLGTGNTSFGGVVTVNTGSVEVESGVTKTIVSIAATHSSLKVLVNINPDIGSNTEFEAVELNITNNGSDVAVTEYGRLTTNIGAAPAAGLGTYHAYVDGANLKVDFIPQQLVSEPLVQLTQYKLVLQLIQSPELELLT